MGRQGIGGKELRISSSFWVVRVLMMDGLLVEGQSERSLSTFIRSSGVSIPMP